MKDITVVMKTFISNTVRDTSFCDAIVNIYDEIVLKIFINTIAKPHVKRLSVKPPPCVVDRCAGGSLTRRPKGSLNVFWPSQLGE